MSLNLKSLKTLPFLAKYLNYPYLQELSVFYTMEDGHGL